MKNALWFLLGIVGGFVIAHMMNKDPRGHELLAEVDSRFAEFTDRMTEAYRSQEAKFAGAGDVLNAAKDAVSDAAGAAKAAAADVLDAVGDAASDTLDAVSDAASDATDGAKDAAASVTRAVKKATD